MRVLVVEDHRALAANICDYLEGRGFTVDFAADGLTGLHLAATSSFDALVLDLGLPGIDGLDIVRLLRKRATEGTPILLLTARDTLDEKLEGFAAGADDYLVKPFALKELEARLRALGRRGRHRSILRTGDLVFDRERVVVERNGRRIDLPPIGLRLLELFMTSPGRVLGREDLEHGLWGDEPPTSDALRTHIHVLRTAVDRPFDKPLLHTVRGVGWVLEKDRDVPA